VRYLLVGLLVIGLCLASCSGDDETSGSPTIVDDSTTTVGEATTSSEATTTTATTTTTAAPTTTVVAPTGWQSIDADPATFGAGTGIGNVAFHPVDNSWVAIGSAIPGEVLEEVPRWHCFESGNCPVRVWRSLDGVTWTQALELAPGPFVSDLTDVRGAPGPLYPTMLAVGAVYDGSVVPARPIPVVWHLDIDGAATATPVVDDDLDAVAGQINGIAGIPLGYAAVGWRCPNDNVDCYGWLAIGRQPTIWVSEDGYDWQIVVVDLGEFTQGWLNDVVGLWSAEPQGWVAVGGDNNRAFAARGSPGGDWTVVELPSNANPSIEYELEDGLGTVSGPCSGTGRAVTVGADGTLVAVGPCVPLEALDAYATSWVSSDGLTWSQTTVPDGLERPAWMRTVAWTGNQYVAGGWLFEPDSPLVWTSPDGLTWSRTVISEAPGGVQDIAVGDGTQLAVGGWDTALMWIR
jgi:hypothetical protein